MIVFYGENFELNLTNLSIKFIEESNFFYTSFFRNYTLPFIIPLDDETSEKLGLIDIDNIVDYKLLKLYRSSDNMLDDENIIKLRKESIILERKNNFTNNKIPAICFSARMEYGIEFYFPILNMM